MLVLTMDEIIKAVNGELYVDGGVYDYNSISIDTRKITEKSLFIALKGEKFNGNEFVGNASKSGAIICIADQINFKEDELNENTTVIKVKDGREALKDLAKYYRSKLDVKIVAVTGSTGKTSTKDLTAAALSSKYKVFKTEGNFNNEVGLPLMIFKLDETYDVAILEMGMSDLGEIHELAKIARPDIALITNIGISHIENLKTRENILSAKLEATDFFDDNSILIVNGDDDLLCTLDNKKYNLIKTGIDNESDLIALNIILEEGFIEFNAKEKSGEISQKLKVPVPGRHNVLNSLLAIACAKQLGLTYEEIQEGILGVESTSRRLDVYKYDNFTIVDDCYNASPDSMKAALEVVSNMKGNRKIAVLGTMRELGEHAENVHQQIGQFAKEKNIDILIAVGEFSDAYRKGFNNDEKFMSFDDKDEAAQHIKDNMLEGDVVLVKASRSMKFETITEILKA